MAQSLFTVQVPALQDINNGADLTTGTVIQVAVAGDITHGRWYCPETHPSGDVDWVLWDLLTETELARATFTIAGLIADAWNTIALGAPEPLTAGQFVVASIETPNRYVATGAFFNGTSVTNGDLFAPATADVVDGNGRFETVHGVYPDDTFNGNCYFVDVVFEPSAAGGAERWRLTL